MKPQISVDIETLASTPDGAVIAIGVLAFDPAAPVGHYLAEKEILLDPRFSPGHRDPDTLEWWSEQGNGVFEQMMSGKLKPHQACGALAGFCLAWPDAPVWANPPSFDIVILRRLFKVIDIDLKFPFSFRQERDYRTIRKFAQALGIDYETPVSNPTPHDALADAKAQADSLKIMLRGLNLLEGVQ